MRIDLARNPYFNAYSNNFSKRSYSSTTDECVRTDISDGSYTYTCTKKCSNGNVTSVSTTHKHDGFSN